MIDLMLFRGALRDLLQPQRLTLAAPLVLGPAALGLLWRAMARGNFNPDVAYNTLAGLLVVFILVLLAAIFGTGVVSQETEGRTIGYLLTRPVPRARILLAKFLGAVTGITITVWVATLLLALVTFGPAKMFQPQVWTDLRVLPVGALAYGSLFLLLAALLNRALIFSLFFAFGWESWVPLLPGVFRNVSILTYLRVLAPHPNPVEEESQRNFLFSAVNPTSVSSTVAWVVLALVIAIALGLALLVFSVKEYAPREDAE